MEQTIISKSRIVPSTVQQTAIDGINRDIAGKLLVLWDGITWTDESTYLIDAKGDWQLTGTMGEGMRFPKQTFYWKIQQIDFYLRIQNPQLTRI